MKTNPKTIRPIEFLASNERCIMYQAGDVFRTIRTIDIDDFYNWLKWDERTAFCVDSVDHNGEHVQRTGDCDWHDYITQTPDYEITKDISDYLDHIKGI